VVIITPAPVWSNAMIWYQFIRVSNGVQYVHLPVLLVTTPKMQHDFQHDATWYRGARGMSLAGFASTNQLAIRKKAFAKWIYPWEQLLCKFHREFHRICHMGESQNEGFPTSWVSILGLILDDLGYPHDKTENSISLFTIINYYKITIIHHY
jgi:hypothetical protein